MFDGTQLLVTDLDGTVLGSMDDRDFHPEFCQRVQDFQASGGLWVIATGRRLRSVQRLVRPIIDAGAVPDFVVARHAYIFSFERWGFLPHPFWNIHIRSIVRREQTHMEEVLAGLRTRLLRTYRSAKLIQGDVDRLHVRFTDLDDCRAAIVAARQGIEHCSSLMIFEFKQDVILRSVPFTKGLAIKEICRHRNVLPESVLAIGDGENDISLLDEAVCGRCGCPANAVDEVMERVHSMGGHIAERKTLGGVIDVLNAFEHGDVSSSLPHEILPPFARDHEEPLRMHRHRSRYGHEWRRVFLGGASAGTAILVLAHYNVLPFSRHIVKPFELVIEFALKLASSLGL